MKLERTPWEGEKRVTGKGGREWVIDTCDKNPCDMQRAIMV